MSTDHPGYDKAFVAVVGVDGSGAVSRGAPVLVVHEDDDVDALRTAAEEPQVCHAT